MRFCDKLPKLRKNNNLSQEQLAERLGVSRQAVSKWESGISYPDMDKLIQICKVLNCTLEELMDDGAISSSSENKRVESTSILQSFLNFITKTINMFFSMTGKEKIKCFFEMCFHVVWIFLFCFLCYGVCYFTTVSLLSNLFSYGRAYYLLENLSSLILFLILLVLGILILLHVFQIRYLDYYVTIEDQNTKVKTIEQPIEREFIPTMRREKIIIRDPKHSISSFFHAIAQAIRFFLKVVAIFGIGVLLMGLILFVVLLAISVSYISFGKFFLFLSCVFIGCVVFVSILLSFLYNFLFNRKVALRKAFAFLLGSVIFSSASLGFAITTVFSFKKVEPMEGLVLEEKEENIVVDEGTHIYGYCNSIEYVVDDMYSSPKLIVRAPSEVSWELHHYKYDNQNEYSFYSYTDFLKKHDLVLNDLKKEQLRNYDQFECPRLKLYLSSSDCKKLNGCVE